MKYILVTGGVISGVGKGIFTSSVGALLKACNLQVTTIKIDPYINLDAGNFSPYEHGEVYVLEDGSEVDLDLGNYERFLDVELQARNNITTGKILQHVINKERKRNYLGERVQMIPHLRNAIKEWIEEAAHGDDPNKRPDVCLIELGGTIGDYECQPFIEALKKLQGSCKKQDFCCCHVSLLIGDSSAELKTRPLQHSVRDLRTYGIYPDMLICRSKVPMTDGIKNKLSDLCDLELNRIFNVPNLETIYKVPIELQKQGMVQVISECMNINACTTDSIKKWSDISEIAVNARENISIALVGKYTASADCYTSVVRSLEHACYSIGAKPKVHYIDSTLLEHTQNGTCSMSQQAWSILKSCQCLLVPGGFGIRGIEGKISAIKWARENKVPFLGICLGFQMAVIEYSRNVLLIKNAHSEEFVSDIKGDIEPVVIQMLEYWDPERKVGGKMRLGSRETKFVVGESILKELYGKQDVIKERHRHRYEINPIHIKGLEEAGLRFVGKNNDETRMEILELLPEIHPYFVAVQFHPEYLSRPFRPSPPYKGLIEAAHYNKSK